MSQFSAELRRKPEWWKSFQNQDVRSSWTEEARERLWNVRTPSSNAEVQLSEKQVTPSCRCVPCYNIDHYNEDQLRSR